MIRTDFCLSYVSPYERYTDFPGKYTLAESTGVFSIKSMCCYESFILHINRIKNSPSNSKWDLVDALENGKVELDKMAESELPAELRKMPKGKRKDYVQKMIKERKEIKKQIGRLSQERSKYVAGKKKEMNAPSVATMDQAITSAVQKQGGAKKFVF